MREGCGETRLKGRGSCEYAGPQNRKRFEVDGKE